jgi:hypothetical protein
MDISGDLSIDPQAIGKGDVAGDLASIGNQTLDGGLLFLVEHKDLIGKTTT